ncbi:hypothetical protein Tco_0789871 [Tanacetum coccineum]
MAQQVVLGDFWFNPRNLPVKHVTPSKSIVLIIEVSSDIPGQMQDMLPGVLLTVLIFLGLTVTNSSSLPIECRMTVNSLVLRSSSGLSMSWRAGIGRMERATSTASSLEAEQDSGNINRTQSMATLNESFPQGTDSGTHDQALVDKKKVIITEKSVRSDLMLEDAEGTECLPNDVFFEQLTLMGVLRIILEILPEHSSDTYVFTVKMEILLEPTSNKILVVTRTASTAVKPCQEDSYEFYGNGYSLKDKNKAKTNKTKHGIEMSVKSRSQRRVHLKRTNPHPFDGLGQPTLK